MHRERLATCRCGLRRPARPDGDAEDRERSPHAATRPCRERGLPVRAARGRDDAAEADDHRRPRRDVLAARRPTLHLTPLHHAGETEPLEVRGPRAERDRVARRRRGAGRDGVRSRADRVEEGLRPTL